MHPATSTTLLLALFTVESISTSGANDDYSLEFDGKMCCQGTCSGDLNKCELEFGDH
jgi:hypothetical protein